MRRAAVIPCLLLIAGAAGGCASLTPYEEIRATLPPENLVDVDGQPVYVEERGSAAGEPVVLLHGFGASSYSWRRVVGRLDGYRVIALDLRGFGYSARPAGVTPYTREGQVELVRGVLDRLGIRRAHLVGHSYGGAVALTFAHRHPDRVRSLALVDSAHPNYPRRRRTALASARPLLDLYLRLVALRPWTVRRALRDSVADDSLVTPELVRDYLRRLRVEGVVRAYRGLTAPAPEEVDREPVEMSEIAVPTLVVWGEEDRLIAIGDGRAAAAELPCHRFVALPDVGHLAMEESPRRLAAELRHFLARPGEVCTSSVPGGAR